ncbi:sulfatase-like hydrolase/transferase [bacterium]|nr:sulfatase-like hydrolase/transferase [bacterium]
MSTATFRILALAAAVLASGCARETPPPTVREATGPLDVLLFTIDTFRADRAGCLGNPDGLTPTMDRIARDGRLARDAYAPAPLTSVSHASMLTGLEPPSHGVRENGSFRLAEDIPTLGTLFGEQGFATAAFVSAFPLDERFGLAHGFDTYDDDVGADRGWISYAERPAAGTVDAALAWLDTDAARDRWFAWVHFFEPHHPRVFPPALQTLARTDDYGREVIEADRQLRRLVQGMLERDGGRGPLIAVVSDHGEGQGDHGELSHGLLVYEESLRGLFSITAPPGTSERDRLGEGPFGGVVRYADLAPTLFDVLGLPFSERIDGRSRLDITEGEDPGAYGETYYPALHYGWSPLTSWRDERWSYVGGPNPELFDRHADPGEQRDVLAEHPDVAETLAARIDAIARDPESSSTMDADAETREKLAALGYLSTSDDLSYDPNKDPKELVGSANALFRGMTLLSQGDVAAAHSMLLSAYRRDPDNVTTVFYLANTFRQLGDTNTAMAYYRRAIELSARAAEAFAHLSILEFERGNRDEAFSLLDRGLAASPESFALALTKADLLLDVGRRGDAEALYRSAAEAEPNRPEPWGGLARLALAEGRRAEAEELWSKAKGLDAAGVLKGASLEGPAPH